MVTTIEPSFKDSPNEWISWHRETHKCSLVESIDAIMRKREPSVSCCISCPMAHFGKYDEYTWRCSETNEILTNVTKLNKNCPIYK